jgi:hypothetical protein
MAPKQGSDKTTKVVQPTIKKVVTPDTKRGYTPDPPPKKDTKK